MILFVHGSRSGSTLTWKQKYMLHARRNTSNGSDFTPSVSGNLIAVDGAVAADDDEKGGDTCFPEEMWRPSR